MPAVNSKEDRHKDVTSRRQIEDRDEDGGLSCSCLPLLNINIDAVIRNIGSAGQFVLYMTKTTIGALIAIIGCVKAGILQAASVAAGATNMVTANCLEAICGFLTSTAPSPCLPFITAFKIHVAPLLVSLSYYAAFMLVVGISVFVIYFIYEAIYARVVADGLGFSTFEDEIRKLNIEPILFKSISSTKAALTGTIP